MSYLDEKPEPFRRGQSNLSARQMRILVSAIMRELRGGAGTNVQDFGDRVVLGTNLPQFTLSDVSNYIAQFVVLEELQDYLICVPFRQPWAGDSLTAPDVDFSQQVFDPALGAKDLIQLAVAKPYALQKTPWNGQTVDGVAYDYSGQGTGTRLADGTAQNITPAYFAGDVITACRSTTGMLDARDYPVQWRDMNEGARQWSSGSSQQRIIEDFIDQGAANVINTGPGGNSNIVAPYVMSSVQMTRGPLYLVVLTGTFTIAVSNFQGGTLTDTFNGSVSWDLKGNGLGILSAFNFPKVVVPPTTYTIAFPNTVYLYYDVVRVTYFDSLMGSPGEFATLDLRLETNSWPSSMTNFTVNGQWIGDILVISLEAGGGSGGGGTPYFGDEATIHLAGNTFSIKSIASLLGAYGGLTGSYP